MNNDNVKSTIRGGQILLHNIRMMQQVIERAMVISIVCLIGMNAAYYFFKPVPPYTRYVTGKSYLIMNLGFLCEVIIKKKN